MSNPHDVRVVACEVTFEPVPFRAPLKFGGRVVDRTDLINAAVTVERRDGRIATGHGSMPVGNVWAWPSAAVSVSEAESAMKAFAERTGVAFGRLNVYGDAIEHGTRLLQTHEETARSLRAEGVQSEPVPPLAQLVAASPIDAALHDAVGRVHDRSSFDVLGPAFLNQDLSAYLDERFAGETLEPYTLRAPKPTMPLYHLVGALDPLTDADVEQAIGDGLPETLAEWVAADGLTHFKIKLAGDDLDWDVDRVLRVERTVAEAKGQGAAWQYSCDFNEKCEDAAYVVEFLNRVRAGSPAAFDRIQYLEQPTHRDLEEHPIPVHEAAAIKPVVIDESLTGYDALLRAVDLGYSGVALKACKGQTESLLMGAAAQKLGLFLCVQDLTCPGASFLHSASLAARIPTVAAIEGNGRQYCPAPNAAWAPKYPGLFEISDGVVRTAELDGPGLGFAG
ncbi:enolase C-terminal domain-like protein [Alienimonas sp. DA493]|uniref:enolase C-terminal domain-like protein n=1 Tax=Alienimonas sp. DA493 TaxID=3373605 RepID=UPI003754D8C6